MKKIHHILLLFLCISSYTSCQTRPDHPSKLQYPTGYPTNEATALEQLKGYPLPRYLPGNTLLRLFNWIDPGYLGSMGKDKPRRPWSDTISYLIQKELITDWNYGIVISNARCAFNGSRHPLEIKLANDYPDVSLDIITFWTQGSPKDIGYNSRLPVIFNDDIIAPYAINFTRDGNKNTEAKFNFPDSLIRIDGLTQKLYLSDIIKQLKRPINRINENGEEPPGPYLVNYIKDDPAMIRMKDSMKINSWDDFASIRKLQMRNAFSSAFMQELPELRDTKFNFYIVEGGPIDRFEWHVMKKCMTPINGIYYSTPDFYPRWPYNWKDWQGAWHGWKWISIGRRTEIKDGDYLFSPFVAAGWSKKNEDNITPGQWLGLLKCLSVIGAEYYYVGYFNLGAPFNDPADYIWQTAMPAYAQAITSRFEDVLKNGNVLFDADKQPIISYPVGDKHVLITARKENDKEKYVICGTYQPFSNDSDEIPEHKNVNVTINGHNLSFEIRRQGSVYIYQKTPDNRTIFYQIDKWHENAHPDHWSKDFAFEGEVADSGISENEIYTISAGNQGDYSNFTSYIKLAGYVTALYHFGGRDTTHCTHYIWLRCKGNGNLILTLNNEKANIVLHKETENTNWQWIKVVIPASYDCFGINTLKINIEKGEIDLDSFVITVKGTAPITN